MKVTSEEIDALVGVLDYYIPDLHAEIARAERGAQREEMRAREARLCNLRQRLLAEREDQAASASG
ncbi:MAG TPA: hypothetical protein VN947_21375 [Polyangia bacterium]|nr:hypothetical protein [Polyangia bacterium]